MFVHVPVTASTNTDLMTRARAGAPHGTILVADHQTAGRGRLGREWISDVGNLYMSVLIRHDLPPARVPLLSLATAVAVAESVTAPLGIKWPNDLLGPDRHKVAGVLCEAERGVAVLGVGVNLLRAPLDLATSLRALGVEVDRLDLARAIGAGLIAHAHRLHIGTSALLAAWRERSCTLGERVQVGAIQGVAEDIDVDGALLVRVGDELTRIVAGDVFLR
jgi:BirA family transcriptional regulator, biotin operon repressor / biotin---[acetyl-CoA-carboxylase] ligase